MLSPSDTVIIFFVALLLFGPEHLPKIAKQLGEAMRHVQSTTSAFMAEMDRAAALAEQKSVPHWEPTPAIELPTPGADAAAVVENAPPPEQHAETPSEPPSTVE